MYSINEAAQLLGVHQVTLRRWEKEGKIKPTKTTGGHRRYSIEELNRLRKVSPKEGKITIGYCRVSSSDQKGDLARQVDNVSSFCTAKGYSFRIIEDLGSGLNYNKKGLKELITLIQTNKVERIVINYKDRLIRFGFEIIEQMCEFHNVEIEIINHTSDKTYEEELVEDMMSTIASFSNCLYKDESHKQKKLKEAVEETIKENS